MRQRLYGSHWLLSRMDNLIIVLVSSFVAAGFWLLRYIEAGVPGDIALSAVHGDVWLTLVIAFGARVLQRPQTDPLPNWLRHKIMHYVCASFAIAAGVYQTLQAGPGLLVDNLHNVALVPVFAYLLLTTIPVVFARGKVWERVAVFILVAGWAAAVRFDSLVGTVNQQWWWLQHCHL